MTRRSVLVAALATVLASVAIACGPEFPWQLLDDRPGTLEAAPANSFDYEAARLVPKPPGPLRVEEMGGRTFEPSFEEDLARAEAEGAPSPVIAAIRAMRSQTTGQAAFEAGADVPEAVRLYTAGAVDFRAGALSGAAERFAAILALPPDAARERAVWAAFMIGRTAAAGGDRAAAEAGYRKTRELAASGAPDPLGLALASYGQEGRLWYQAALGITGEDGPVPPGSAASYGDAVSRAVRLYAEQAAAGSGRGILSLRFVAEGLLKDETRVAAAVGDPTVQRLLVVYVLASGTEAHPALPWLVAGIERAGPVRAEGADRLAALAYRGGRFDLAGRAASLVRTPLASWVQAKLALRRGDLDGAAAAYAAAARAFPAGTLDDEASRLLGGERGVLSLARGEYQAALRFLLAGPTPYWADAAYVAERVLTTDELMGIVEGSAMAGGPVESDGETLASLRDVLARRLFRDGRIHEALPYYKEEETRALARSYLEARDAAESRWTRIGRAQAWFEAAVLARRHGLEMMGAEGPPDYAAFGGNYDTGFGRDSAEGPFVTADETRRVAASGIRPDLRFHYRFVALDHATRAADLLPPRSQAFAAVLCRASLWMLQTPGGADRGQAAYARYVREGARVPFAATFGRECPEPDFDHADRASRPAVFRRLRAWLGWL